MSVWLPRSLFGRMVLLFTAGLIFSQATGAAIHLFERQHTLGHALTHEVAQRIVALHRTIDSLPDHQQPVIAASLSIPRLQIAIEDSHAQDASNISSKRTSAPIDELTIHLRDLLGRAAQVETVASSRFGTFSFDSRLRLSSGRWLRVTGGAPDEVFSWPWHLLINLSIMLVTVVGLVAVAARGISQPLADLAGASRRLSSDLRQPPIPVRGPSETQEAAKAFNLMQERIRDGIEERERFLAAVSHDLKTPITRLRLRAELVSDPLLQERFCSDLDDMQHLIDSALDFLRGKTVSEPVQTVDIVALVESLVDDYDAVGRVTLSAIEALQCPARPHALKRALTNLLDNALKYGGCAVVKLDAGTERICITVDDDGPGIPPADLERVFEPFYRLEHSRSRDTGGSGLGLAIARQIARVHGGDVTLINLPAGGLSATLTLAMPGNQ